MRRIRRSDPVFAWRGSLAYLQPVRLSLGEWTLPHDHELRRGRALFVDGVRITDDEDWFHVPMPAAARASGAPSQLGVRIALEELHDGRRAVEARSLRIGDTVIASHDELVESGASPWIGHLAEAFQHELERLMGTPRAASGIRAAVAEPGVASAPGHIREMNGR